ncbi:hypothetical protein EG329_011151 [Mollisiaceae sp. DMI_Dod_QoI]|nr:hypothetical protein EG329_011151 [Helotiales sp. DMI_Dod_QoI]
MSPWTAHCLHPGVTSGTQEQERPNGFERIVQTPESIMFTWILTWERAWDTVGCWSSGARQSLPNAPSAREMEAAGSRPTTQTGPVGRCSEGGQSQQDTICIPPSKILHGDVRAASKDADADVSWCWTQRWERERSSHGVSDIDIDIPG